jgi:ubiquinone/menaquinone biosynthesis C-methylase UbiE
VGATVRVVPDPIFAHPRLAPVYDAFEANRVDLLPYLQMAQSLGSHHVLDVGCGTGCLALLLAESGHRVTAVDPAAASLRVAESKPGAEAVTWVHGDATTLPQLEADAAMMTGNVAQVFVDDGDWTATLHGIRGALRPEGHLIFETRRPDRREWEEWAADTGATLRDIPGIAEVERRFEVTEVAFPYVTFRYTYTFASDSVVVTSDSTLRFRSREEVESALATSGFTTLEILDAPDRPGLEYVFVAQRS